MATTQCYSPLGVTHHGGKQQSRTSAGLRESQFGAMLPADELGVEPRRLGSRLKNAKSFKSSQELPKDNATRPPPAYEPLFGSTETQRKREPFSSERIGGGEEALLNFIQKNLGTKAQLLAVRLKNRTPVKAASFFSYVLRQGSTEADVQAMDAVLSSGRLYRNGVLLQGGAWSRVLLGPRYALGASNKQIHELEIHKDRCDCLACRIKEVRSRSAPGVSTADNPSPGAADQQAPMDRRIPDPAAVSISGHSESAAGSKTRLFRPSRRKTEVKARSSVFDVDTPTASPWYQSFAPQFDSKRDYVCQMPLPAPQEMQQVVSARLVEGELFLGEVVRLNSRGTGKFKVADDVKQLFGSFAYTGPLTTSSLVSKIVGVATDYYRAHKGKKVRRVYVRGQMAKIEVPAGVIKLPLQPLVVDEIGAPYVLHSKQV